MNQLGQGQRDWKRKKSRQLEKALELENEKKLSAQIASAKKSLIYNLFMASLITSTIAVSVVLPSPVNFYFIGLFPTVQKGLLCVLTTVANFSAVRSVLLQYWSNCP